MKKLFSLISRELLALAMVFALLPVAPAAPIPLVTVTLTNTTNTVPSVLAYSYQQPLQNASISHGVLTNNITPPNPGGTNTSLFINVYANAPNSTATNGRVFLGTWYPASTNATTETILGSNFPITNYLSFDICTSNSVIIYGSYGQ